MAMNNQQAKTMTTMEKMTMEKMTMTGTKKLTLLMPEEGCGGDGPDGFLMRGLGTPNGSTPPPPLSLPEPVGEQVFPEGSTEAAKMEADGWERVEYGAVSPECDSYFTKFDSEENLWWKPATLSPGFAAVDQAIENGHVNTTRGSKK